METRPVKIVRKRYRVDDLCVFCLRVLALRQSVAVHYPFGSAKGCFGNGGLTRFTCKIDRGSRLFLLSPTYFSRGIVTAASGRSYQLCTMLTS